MTKVGTIDVYEDEFGNRYVTEDGVVYTMIHRENKRIGISLEGCQTSPVDIEYFTRTSR